MSDEQIQLDDLPLVAVKPAKTATTQLTFQHYKALKRKYPKHLLFMRHGDFYELFCDDVEAVAKVIGLTLTVGTKNGSPPIPMCGFPHYLMGEYGKAMRQAGYQGFRCEPKGGA